jgi:hypothetical protein
MTYGYFNFFLRNIGKSRKQGKIDHLLGETSLSHIANIAGQVAKKLT